LGLTQAAAVAADVSCQLLAAADNSYALSANEKPQVAEIINN